VKKFEAWVLLVLLFAAPSLALDFRRVGELRLQSSGSLEWLDPHRYVRVKNEWERTPKSMIRRVTFVVADVVEQKLLRFPFPLDEFQKSHPSLFTGPPNADLLYFDGTSALLRFARFEPMRTVSYYSIWNVKTQALTEPVQLGETIFTSNEGKQRVSRLTYLVGPDPAASRLYFAEVTYDDRPAFKPEPIAIHFFRMSFPELKKDWELDLNVPKRTRQLPLETYRTFSFDGKKLAMAEYYDRAAQREFKPVPPPQVYVIDFEQKKVSTYPIPRTPYGLSFSRDGRYLAVGSHEENEIIRIDLEAGHIDRRVKAQTHLQKFVTTASGDSLIVMSDHIGAPRSIEIRRWKDLSLQETIPISRLFPGIAGIHPSEIRATNDGRYLVARPYKEDGYPDSSNAGLVTFAIEEEKSAGRPDPTALVLKHVERNRVDLYRYQMSQVGNTEGYFAPIVANDKGEAFVIGRTRDLPEDAPFEAGESHPYAIWVDARGKVVWEKSLRGGKVFFDYEGGSAVATPDGAFIAFFLCYADPRTSPASRLVKVDRKGKVVWDWTSRIGKDARFPEQLRLLPSGRVLMKGHVGSSQTPWVGELDARTGKLVRDEVGSQP
jgi:hypothetical protein